MPNDIPLEWGDIGTVDGRDELFMIVGGAQLPGNVQACGRGDKDAYENKETLLVWNAVVGDVECVRSAFHPYTAALAEERWSRG